MNVYKAFSARRHQIPFLKIQNIWLNFWRQIRKKLTKLTTVMKIEFICENPYLVKIVLLCRVIHKKKHFEICDSVKNQRYQELLLKVSKFTSSLELVNSMSNILWSLRNILQKKQDLNPSWVQCARAKRGKFLKASPAFMVTFSAKNFSMTQSLYTT